MRAAQGSVGEHDGWKPRDSDLTGNRTQSSKRKAGRCPLLPDPGPGLLPPAPPTARPAPRASQAFTPLSASLTCHISFTPGPSKVQRSDPWVLPEMRRLQQQRRGRVLVSSLAPRGLQALHSVTGLEPLMRGPDRSARLCCTEAQGPGQC